MNAPRTAAICTTGEDDKTFLFDGDRGTVLVEDEHGMARGFDAYIRSLDWKDWCERYGRKHGGKKPQLRPFARVAVGGKTYVIRLSGRNMANHWLGSAASSRQYDEIARALDEERSARGYV